MTYICSVCGKEIPLKENLDWWSTRPQHQGATFNGAWHMHMGCKDEFIEKRPDLSHA